MRGQRRMIEISVIIPTHNRVEMLKGHLLLLAEQSLGSECFEVVVSADGCTDGTADIVRELDVPYRLVAIEKNPGTGAAGARNRGAEVASASLLLFLDDDMEPSRELLRAHVQAHRAKPGSIVLGYYPMYPPEDGESSLIQFARLWWAERFALRSRPDHRFSFYDFCTGNVSLALAVFRCAGGFEESISKLGAGEDYELGYRLIRQRVPFQFVRDAESIHHSKVTNATFLKRMREDGYGQALMARKHPELFWEFNVSRLSRLSNSTVFRPLWVALWRFPGVAEFAMAPIRLIAKLSVAINADSIFQKCHRLLKAYAYWCGVVEALGTLSVWERLSQDAPFEPYDVREIDMDLSQDLENLEDFLDTRGPADAIRLLVSGESVGRIAPWAAGEALTAPCLRSVLIAKYGSVLLGELVTRRRRTDCKADGVAPADSQAEVSGRASSLRSGGLNWPQ
jgi:GT2 family glycosyltransferase